MIHTELFNTVKEKHVAQVTVKEEFTYIIKVCTLLQAPYCPLHIYTKCVLNAKSSFYLKTHTHTTQILSWTRWIQTAPWRSWRQVLVGASAPLWSLTDPGAGTAVEGAGPSAPPPWRPRRKTPRTGPTGWRRRPLPRRRTRWSPLGSTPRTWWERCAAWSSPPAGPSRGRGQEWGHKK